MEAKKYYKIRGRSAWDTVEIGLFESKEAAVRCCNESRWDTGLISEATDLEVELYAKK